MSMLCSVCVSTATLCLQVLQKFCRMAGEPERSIKCDIMTCDSEMDNAHKNYAILHYMKSMGVSKPLEFMYTSLCVPYIASEIWPNFKI